VQLALQRGLTDIVLLGQSLGTARAVYYQAKTGQPAVKALVLTAPIPSPYLEAQVRWDEAERAAYNAFLDEQRAAIAAGAGRRLASYAWWGNDRILEVSAATWVNLFSPAAESDASTVEFAPGIKLPVLVVYGTEDETVSPGLASEVLAAFTASPVRHLRAIKGANHVFIGFEKQLADAVTGWLLEHVPPGVPDGEDNSSPAAAEAK
jgi:pimeloyl-ACP methyl ester carboxylesterase